MSESKSVLLPIIGYLKRCIGYEGFMTAASVGIVYYSNSHTAVFPFLFAAGGVLCLWLMLYTIKAAVSGDFQRYPYGTGRLENVSAILLSMIFTAGTMMPFVQASRALLAGDVRVVSMGWTFVILIVSASGNGLQSIRARKLRKTIDNPILSSLHHSYHAGSVRDGVSSAVIGLCWLLKGGSEAFMYRLDAFATLILSVYSLYHFLPQIWTNFRALADFPLPEDVQLKIMGLLARHFDEYEMPGRIYTTNRGNTLIIEVELAFNPTMSVGELIELERVMREDFRGLFPGCVLRIIPRTLPG